MSNSFDIDKLKKRTQNFSKTWQKKLSYLSESVSRDGIDGAFHWLKSHNQIEELSQAVDELLIASEESDFRLTQVDTVLSSFNLPEEDAGQAEWYKTADLLVGSFYNSLKNDNIFNKQLLQNALKELKFIKESDEFHKRYNIQSIQQKVAQLYSELNQALSDFKQLEKEKLATAKEQEKLEIAKLEAEKAQAEAKKAMMESVKIKEKRLAIIEEKKRKQAEKELLESQSKVNAEQAELAAKQAETERQAKLQDAYIDLQLEEKIKNWNVQDLVNMLQQKLESEELPTELSAKIAGLIEELQG
ncbi:hypothetical protein ACUR5C_01070 [Aliikangiella sp. IMCC44653]